ncbi:facilitated trehalose transporter Tret1-like isoform X2 [Venturia canescens]|uniref:facilitated trehalose transporter Tret1-like isoform X2 n=1 Tax=Venturia canescens TaxID=32260 RepID=UPI001C9BE0F2|nr:facilitated trehalose transporter Tret1-like isoform X2 [Venturia canescens]
MRGEREKFAPHHHRHHHRIPDDSSSRVAEKRLRNIRHSRGFDVDSITLFAGPLGCLVSGPISEFMGRKKAMLISNIPYTISWILLYYAATPTMLYIPMALGGFIGGLIEGPILTYVSEITQPHLRGPLSATASMAVIVGVFFEFAAGSFVDWRYVALINILFPVLCAITLSMVPESPYWLAGKGRVKDAEKALRFFRGWVSPSHVQDELQTVLNSVGNTSDEKNSDNVKKEKRWEPYFKMSVVKPFLLVISAFAGDAFGGSTVVQTYAISIFEALNSPIDTYNATVCLGVAEVAGTLLCVGLIHFTGKRKISFVSMLGTGLCYLGTSIYSFLLNNGDIEPESWTWAPTTLIIGSALLSHLGLKLVAWILIGEVFPATVRSGATGVAAAVGYVVFSIANKIYLYMVDGMKIYGTFMFYAVINFLTCILMYFILPETEGRSLQEIEEHYAGINKIANKPRKEALPFKEKFAASNPVPVNDETESKL